MTGKPFEYNLTVNLPESEIMALGKDLGNQIAELNLLEEEKTRVVKEYNNKITALETIITRLAKIQQTGQDDRPVTCHWEYHTPEKDYMTMYRDDTSEQVETREMRDRDYDIYESLQQLELELK